MTKFCTRHRAIVQINIAYITITGYSPERNAADTEKRNTFMEAAILE